MRRYAIGDTMILREKKIGLKSWTVVGSWLKDDNITYKLQDEKNKNKFITFKLFNYKD